ncbi:Bug family tripartite tricarboxylate transporter substrate binding protein [Candidatus Formimonas warabiya]|uniref:Tripartite tricarboxylate transporter substrate binding protein n=1 Tax=Formimonas warabiya TaxID=1761012 RepID=A0A3G1KSC6_FORW1|nr:tripartite tricarboxylate transporter substrate binding protein [Candidatus Formimonas warabiya]ATW25402.1 hypothetical protein DCMF_12020 [Candidatus Formimonas warabiya]
MRLKRIILLTMMVFLILSLVGCSAGDKAYPNRPIEFVCQTNAGGSSDAFLRTVADMLTKEKLINVPITVSNKPGGGGAVAYKYVADKKGDPYVVLSATSTFITTPLQSKDCPNYTQFAPICMLACDPSCIIVKTDSPYQTLADLIADSKNREEGITWALASVGSSDHVMGIQFARMIGGKIVFVPQTSDGETIVAVLGGHADVGSMSMRSALGQVEAGRMRILAISSVERAKKLPDVPTLKEIGYNLVSGIPRGVVAPKDIPEDAREVLIEAFKKLLATERWKKYVYDECLVSEEYFGDDFTSYLKRESEMYEPLLREIGFIK